MNQNISKYLDAYLNKKDTSYAVLLTGTWGCGKTHFIKKYIGDYEQKNSSTTDDKKNKFIYISLFGLKEISAIYELIFQSIHPVLSSKPVKLFGGVLKAAAKLSIPIDLNGNNDKDANLNLDLEKLLLWDKKNTNNLFFVFDDLERSLIETSEILGFINNLTENENQKVIIIANEEEIKDKSQFDLFKEKVIGKSFMIQNNHNEYWHDFSQKHQFFSEQQIEKIKDIFIKSGYENFRILNQSVDNFLIFVDNIDKEFKKNISFYEDLIGQFFPLSFFYYKNNSCKKFSDINDSILFGLFSEEDWKTIISDFYQDTQKLNKKISELAFFHEQENWVQLWRYRQKTSEEFYPLLEEVKDEFINFQYEKIEVVIHVFSMLIYFIKTQVLTELEIDDVKAIVEQYIEKYKDDSTWLGYEVFDEFHNSTGLVFQNTDDTDVQKIKEQLQEKINIFKKQHKENNLQTDLNALIHNQFNLDLKDMWEIFKRYEHKPILDRLESSILNEIANNHNFARKFIRFLNTRYSNRYTLNGKKLTFHLKDELPKMKEFKERLNHAHSNATDNFDKLRFKETIDYLNEIIARFDSSE